MGSRWLREIPGSAYNYKYWTSTFWKKVIPFFINRVMGYTLQSETVAGGKSFVSYQKTGVGDVTGTGFNFTRTSGDVFASTDVESWIFIRDDTNPQNGGAYRITGYVDTSNITIDFASGPTEYPTASSAVTWWLLSDDYQVPSTNGDVISLQSRHATGWAIRLTISGAALTAQVCVDGVWANGKILGAAETPALLCGSNESNLYSVEGDYDGEWLNLLATQLEYGGNNYASATNMISVGRIDPVETGHDTLELTALNGSVTTSWGLGLTRQTQTHDLWGFGRIWNMAANAQKYIYPIELSIGGRTNTLEYTRFPRGAQVNHHNGDRLGVRYGTYFIHDFDNVEGQYQLYGRVKGHWTIPCGFESVTEHGWNVDWNVLSQRRQKRFFPVTWQTNKDFLVLQNGFMIPWPGVGPARIWY